VVIKTDHLAAESCDAEEDECPPPSSFPPSSLNVIETEMASSLGCSLKRGSSSSYWCLGLQPSISPGEGERVVGLTFSSGDEQLGSSQSLLYDAAFELTLSARRRNGDQSPSSSPSTPILLYQTPPPPSSHSYDAKHVVSFAAEFPPSLLEESKLDKLLLTLAHNFGVCAINLTLADDEKNNDLQSNSQGGGLGLGAGRSGFGGLSTLHFTLLDPTIDPRPLNWDFTEIIRQSSIPSFIKAAGVHGVIQPQVDGGGIVDRIVYYWGDLATIFASDKKSNVLKLQPHDDQSGEGLDDDRGDEGVQKTVLAIPKSQLSSFILTNPIPPIQIPSLPSSHDGAHEGDVLDFILYVNRDLDYDVAFYDDSLEVDGDSEQPRLMQCMVDKQTVFCILNLATLTNDEPSSYSSLDPSLTLPSSDPALQRIFNGPYLSAIRRSMGLPVVHHQANDFRSYGGTIILDGEDYSEAVQCNPSLLPFDHRNDLLSSSDLIYFDTVINRQRIADLQSRLVVAQKIAFKGGGNVQKLLASAVVEYNHLIHNPDADNSLSINQINHKLSTILNHPNHALARDFPIEHWLAVLAPLWVPLCMPLLVGVLKEGRSFYSKRRRGV
jgi:hypothetical protein